MLPASAAGIAVVLVLVWITPVETFNSTIQFEWGVGREAWSVEQCLTLHAPGLTPEARSSPPGAPSLLGSVRAGRSHLPNAGRPGVIPRGEELGTLEEKLYSVYDEYTALIQTGRPSYIYLPTRKIDTSLRRRNARAPRG